MARTWSVSVGAPGGLETVCLLLSLEEAGRPLTSRAGA